MFPYQLSHCAGWSTKAIATPVAIRLPSAVIGNKVRLRDDNEGASGIAPKMAI